MLKLNTQNKPTRSFQVKDTKSGATEASLTFPVLPFAQFLQCSFFGTSKPDKHGKKYYSG